MYTLERVTNLYPRGRETVTALQEVGLRGEGGGWLTTQGRTGHNKSTLLHMLGGPDRPTSGRVVLDGYAARVPRVAQMGNRRLSFTRGGDAAWPESACSS
jgi:putative ABC transport system ATP-binding protein